MNILVLLKHNQLDESIINFVTSLLKKGEPKFHLLNIISTSGDIPTQPNGEVIEFCTEFDLTEYQKKSALHLAYLEAFKHESIVARHSYIGNRRDIIQNYIETKGIDLVVGGAHKTTALEDIFVTTFASDVLEHTTQPFLTIKCNRDNFKPKRIALVHDFLKVEDQDLEIVKKISAMHNSEIVLTKILTKQDHRTETDIEKAMRNYAQGNGLNATTQIIKSIDKEKGVSEIQSEHQTDLIVIGREHKKTLSTFLGHSDLSSIVNHVYAPILIY